MKGETIKILPSLSGRISELVCTAEMAKTCRQPYPKDSPLAKVPPRVLHRVPAKEGDFENASTPPPQGRRTGKVWGKHCACSNFGSAEKATQQKMAQIHKRIITRRT